MSTQDIHEHEHELFSKSTAHSQQQLNTNTNKSYNRTINISTSVNSNTTTNNLPHQESSLFKWGERSSQEIISSINRSYEQIVYWRRNLFLVPSGSAGKKFVSETTRLINAFVDSSALKSISL